MGLNITDVLERAALLADLPPSAREELRSIARPFAVSEGALLFRQGDPPGGLYLLGEGSLEIASRMPGDDTSMVSRIAPGEVVGEFALLDNGLRSANVRALADSTGLFVPARAFLALLGDARPGAVGAIDALRGLVARRTRATLERIVAGELAEASELRAAPLAASSKPVDLTFDMIRSLGRFARLDDAACAALCACAAASQVERGSALFAAGSPSDAALFVMRGAVRAGIERANNEQAGQVEQVAIHGPGEWAGLAAMIDGGSQPLSASAAETSVVLRVQRSTFDGWRRAPDALGQAVLRGVDRQLVRDQRRANRHLGRAVALERFNSSGEH